MHPNDGRVVSKFYCSGFTKSRYNGLRPGNQTRSFQYVDDLIEGMIRHELKDSFTGPVNIGNPIEFTILELAQK
jgi:UDP-glucuronate decarboxylase